MKLTQLEEHYDNGHLTLKQNIHNNLKYIAIFLAYTIICITLHFTNVYWPSQWNKSINKTGLLAVWILPLAGSFIFGVVDAGSFFILDEELEEVLNSYIHNIATTSILIGSISAFFALFIGSSIKSILEKIFRVNLEGMPILDGIGLLLGTGFVLSLYYLSHAIKGEHFTNQDINDTLHQN